MILVYSMKNYSVINGLDNNKKHNMCFFYYILELGFAFKGAFLPLLSILKNYNDKKYRYICKSLLKTKILHNMLI